MRGNASLKLDSTWPQTHPYCWSPPDWPLTKSPCSRTTTSKSTLASSKSILFSGVWLFEAVPLLHCLLSSARIQQSLPFARLLLLGSSCVFFPFTCEAALRHVSSAQYSEEVCFWLQDEPVVIVWCLTVQERPPWRDSARPTCLTA